MNLKRRQFLKATASTGLATFASSWTQHLAKAEEVDKKLSAQSSVIKPIQGSWISILWDDDRHHYWNETCRKFTAEQWKASIKEMADFGIEYLVLLAIAKGGKSFYDSKLLPKAELACDDPIGAILSAGDECGVKFFISSDWYAKWDHHALEDPHRVEMRCKMMEEIVELYGDHKSFYGWYWPNEPVLQPYFADSFVRYINACGAEAKKITPKAKRLIAPYGTFRAVNLDDDRYAKQLENLDVDIIAYQDEVGCLRMDPKSSEAAFAKLRKIHDRVPQRKLWADVETFAWEGPANRNTSRLIPAPFPRVREQLAAVSPYADVVLIYQYQGIFSAPDSLAPSDHPEAVTLYNDYQKWRASGGR